MKIGLYLQDLNQNKKNIKEFNNAMAAVKKAKLDLLVFPECCYTPFSEKLYFVEIGSEDGLEKIEDYCIELSESIGSAIIYSGNNKEGLSYSFYANAFADVDKDETYSKIYVKHTMTRLSAFDLNLYKNNTDINLDTIFEPIILKEKRIGMTICFECNNSAFSRGYGKKDIDILINSSGGDVVYDKWHKYNKVRSIENNCFNFCTMGYEGDYKKIKSYVLGYSPNGKSVTFKNLLSKTSVNNKVGTIYAYDTDTEDGAFEEDSSLEQISTVNKYETFFYSCGNVNELISKSKEIDKNLFVFSNATENIVLCILKDKEILKPERILFLLYHEKLRDIKNKRYIVINKWEHLDEKIYRYYLSDILKVRAMENYCAIILESDTYNNCYQCGKNRTAQVVKSVDGKYGIDLERTSGPETIWKNKYGIKASWRNEFEILVNYLKKY